MDIVYVLKNGIHGDELKYSLRSLKNFTHDKVWFYGGKPKGLVPDVMVEYSQHGRSKWEKVRNMLIAICENDDISPEFWLFNDDFFCMKPVSHIPAYYHGTLYQRIVEIEKRYGSKTTYSKELRKTADLLEHNGLDTKNYAVHLPMLIDRARAKVVLEEFTECPMFRSLYGNSCDIGGEDRDDVKIYDTFTLPQDPDWLSTSNNSFEYGEVGEYIRDRFKDPSPYERDM